MDINLVEEFIRPVGGYSFSASETYSSDVFAFRTGKAISVLEIKYAEQFNIMLYGEYQVSTDDECWDIVWKFRRYQLSTIMKTIIDEATSSGARNGKLSLQLQLQTLLGL